MRKLLSTLLFLLPATATCFGQLTSTTDERFELTSIVCRLAGAEEYSQCRIPGYARDIDSCFAPYTKHPVIRYFQQIREKQDVAYDAISSLASALELRNGRFRLNPAYDLRPLADTAVVTQIDSRWTKASLDRFIVLLNDFYKQSRFQRFYDAHQPLYQAVTEQLDKLLAKIDPEWFVAFFGKEFSTPQVYTCLVNGPSNYALTNLPDDAFGILVGCGADAKGDPSFSPWMLGVVLHEFAHSFANPLVCAYQAQLEKPSKRIFPLVEKSLRHAAYNQAAIPFEWLTRLSVLMYLRDNDPQEIPFQITIDDNQGFIWQRRAVAFMENFYANRDRYPYFSDFMPQMVSFLDFTAQEFDNVLNEYQNRHPYVVNVYPAAGSKLDLTRDTVEFRMSFSEPMNTYCHGHALLGSKLDELEKIKDPTGWFESFWKDEYTFVIRMKPQLIEIGGVYGFSLNKDFNQNKKNYGMTKDFKVTFDTGQQ